MKTEFLTQDECAAMRGIAILAIMLHNYCHFIGGIVSENEFLFKTSNNDGLLQALTAPDSLLPVHLFSYFGHYGVPVFLFLSGFGLIVKYERKVGTGTVNVLPFIRYHYLKLLKMLIVGYVLFIIANAILPPPFPFHWRNIIAQLVMCINVLPSFIIYPGIYWFFGLMLELYIIFRLAFYRQQNYIVVALMFLCWLLQAFCNPEGQTLLYFRYNFIGSMLPFGIGILAGRFADKINVSLSRWLWLGIAIVISVIVVGMCFSYQLWLWIPLLIIIGSIAFVKALPRRVLVACTWLGSISAAVFVIHPTTRKLFITVVHTQVVSIYDGIVIYVLVTFALSWAVNKFINLIPNPKLV